MHFLIITYSYFHSYRLTKLYITHAHLLYFIPLSIQISKKIFREQLGMSKKIYVTKFFYRNINKIINFFL